MDPETASFSFLLYVMQRLRRRPRDHLDREEYRKDIKSADSMWMFLYYFIKFCSQKQWDGMKMKKYWSQITQNGAKTNEFAWTFTVSVHCVSPFVSRCQCAYIFGDVTPLHSQHTTLPEIWTRRIKLKRKMR